MKKPRKPANWKNGFVRWDVENMSMLIGSEFGPYFRIRLSNLRALHTDIGRFIAWAEGTNET